MQELSRDSDQDNYIYLSDAHFSTNSIELLLKWSSTPEFKPISLSVQSNCSFEFLSVRIGEVMEKFSVFEGLNNLRACNLTKNKQPLPKKGEISKHCKSGDIISFDLTSFDLWLTIAIAATPLNKAVGFQIKVPKSYSIQQLKDVILNYFTSLSQLDRSDSLAQYKLDMRRSAESKLVGTASNLLQTFSEFDSMVPITTGALEVKDLFTFMNSDLACKIDFQGRHEIPPNLAERSAANEIASLPIRKISMNSTLADSSMASSIHERKFAVVKEKEAWRCMGCALI